MKVDILVPDSLSEITLEQYQRFIKIQDSEQDEMFLARKMMEIFCGVKLTDTLNIKLKDVKAITEILSEMLNDKPQLVKKFTLNGVQYGFIPKLDDISLGEYVDLDTFLGDIENLHRAMAVLYRPIKHTYGEKYNIEEYKVTDGEIMKQMPLDAVFSSVLFFYRLGIDLSQAMMNYLEDKEKEAIVQHLSSQASGDGINQYSHSLMGILHDLKISLN